MSDPPMNERHILIVDDEELYRELLGGRLGHGDGGVALERAVAVVVILIVVPAGADVRLRVTQHPHRASLPCG